MTQTSRVSFSPICGNPLEVSIKRKDMKLYCRKYSKILSTKELQDKKCLSKREYLNDFGEKINIICPHLLDLSEKAQEYYKLVKDTTQFGFEEGKAFQINHEFKGRLRKAELERQSGDIFEEQRKKLRKILEVGYKGDVWG